MFLRKGVLLSFVRVHNGDVKGVLEQVEEPQAVLLASVALQRTGRATNDGWQEWSSGEVDFSLGGAISNPVLVMSLAGHPFPADPGLGGLKTIALVDALEVADLGPAAVPGVACRLPDEAMTFLSAGRKRSARWM